MARTGSRNRRVVVTGLGCVSPLGVDVAQTWKAALEGRSGVAPITQYASDFSPGFAGEVKGVATARASAAKASAVLVIGLSPFQLETEILGAVA